MTNESTDAFLKYRIKSLWEFKLQNADSVRGTIYCVDPVSETIVVVEESSNSIHLLSLSSVRESTEIEKAPNDEEPSKKEIEHSKKVLVEREKRALKLARESLKHLNPKATPRGQMIFDRLLKACNEVVWKDESIIVLQTIKVDPPYEQDNCVLLKAGTGQGSLDRVQKIVAAAGTST